MEKTEYNLAGSWVFGHSPLMGILRPCHFLIVGFLATIQLTIFFTQVPAMILCLNMGSENHCQVGLAWTKVSETRNQNNPPSSEVDPLRLTTEMEKSVTVPHGCGTTVHSLPGNHDLGTTRKGVMTKNFSPLWGRSNIIIQRMCSKGWCQLLER